VTSLTAIAPVRRLAGHDRFATASAVASDERRVGSDVVTVSGVDPADAPAALARAAARDAAILLVRPDDLPASTADALASLEPATITVIGGTAAVSRSTELALARHL
jgi:putative cell wall-binding protein